MYRVYAFDADGREVTQSVSLLLNVSEAREKAAAFRQQGLLPRVYAQRTDRFGNIVETLLEC